MYFPSFIFLLTFLLLLLLYDRCVRIVSKFPCTFGQASRATAFAQVFTLKRYPKITSLRTQSVAARKIESSEL